MNTDNTVGIDVCEIRGLVKDLFDKLCGESGREWLSALKLFLQKQNPWPVVNGVLADMIEASHYDWVSDAVNERNFLWSELVPGFGLKLYHFGHTVSLEDAVAAMDADGYRPGKLVDLIDYGAKNPEEQRKYRIIALGSIGHVDGHHHVACLGEWRGKRILYPVFFADDWDGTYRFLAVLK